MGARVWSATRTPTPTPPGATSARRRRCRHATGCASCGRAIGWRIQAAPAQRRRCKPTSSTPAPKPPGGGQSYRLISSIAGVTVQRCSERQPCDGWVTKTEAGTGTGEACGEQSHHRRPACQLLRVGPSDHAAMVSLLARLPALCLLSPSHADASAVPSGDASNRLVARCNALERGSLCPRAVAPPLVTAAARPHLRGTAQ